MKWFIYSYCYLRIIVFYHYLLYMMMMIEKDLC